MDITIIQMPPDNYKDLLFKGKYYKTLDGRTVKIINDTYHKFPEGSHARCVQGSDGSWRYGHSGRVTGCDVLDPRNIDPALEVDSISFKESMVNLKLRINRVCFNFKRNLTDPHLGWFTPYGTPAMKIRMFFRNRRLKGIKNG